MREAYVAILIILTACLWAATDTLILIEIMERDVKAIVITESIDKKFRIDKKVTTGALFKIVGSSSYSEVIYESKVKVEVLAEGGGTMEYDKVFQFVIDFIPDSAYKWVGPPDTTRTVKAKFR